MYKLTALLVLIFVVSSNARTFQIVNKCHHEVHIQSRGAGGPNGRVGAGQTAHMGVSHKWNGRMWANGADNKATLGEFCLACWNNLDNYNLSVIDGYNLPMRISPHKGGCPTVACHGRPCSQGYNFPADNSKMKTCHPTDYTIQFC